MKTQSTDPFTPDGFNLKPGYYEDSEDNIVKSKKGGRKSRKGSRKSRKGGKKSRKGSRKSRKGSRKSRK